MPRLSALQYGLKLLGYKARTVKELKAKLLEKKYLPDETEAVLVKLAAIGWVDDQKFADNYVRDKLSINRRGPRRIYFELIQRGVDKEIAHLATKTVDPQEELEMATSLLKSRSRQWSKLDQLSKKRRAIGLLARRGFSGSVVRNALTSVDL